MTTPTAEKSRAGTRAFLALALPYLVVFLADQVVLRRHYYDDSASYSLHYWIVSSLGWLHSRWAPLFLDSAGGLRTHHPSIPEAELGALLMTVIGWNENTLEIMAVSGIGLNALLVLGAAWWGARMAARGGLPWWPLAVAASLAAVQPGVMFTWSSYPHYVILLLPCGLALYLLASRPQMPPGEALAALVVLGFALGLQYPAAAPIIAVLMAMLIAARDGRDPSFCDRMAAAARPAWTLAAISFGAMLVLGLVLAQSGLLARLPGVVHALRDGIVTAWLALLGIAAALIVLCGGAARILPRTTFGRALLSVGGRMTVGWVLGANLLASYAWASGLQAIPPASRAGFLASIPYCLWMIVPFLLLVAGAALIIRSVTRTDASTGDRFLGILMVFISALNLAAVPAVPAGPTIAEFGNGRYLASVVVALPALLLWLSDNTPSWVHRLGSGLAFLIAAAAWIQYASLVRPAAAHETALHGQVRATIADFLSSDPEAHLLCGGFYGAPCGLAFTMDYYESFHRANTRNAPLPSALRTHRAHTLDYLPDRECASADACLSPLLGGRKGTVLLIARKRYVPAALTEAGDQIHPRQPFVEPVIVRRIRVPAAAN